MATTILTIWRLHVKSNDKSYVTNESLHKTNSNLKLNVSSSNVKLNEIDVVNETLDGINNSKALDVSVGIVIDVIAKSHLIALVVLINLIACFSVLI